MRGCRPGLHRRLVTAVVAAVVTTGALVVGAGPAVAASGDATAAGLTGSMVATLPNGAQVPVDASVAAVKAPPDASALVENARLDRPLPGLPGTGLVAQAELVKTSATSTATGSGASASVHSVKLHTPAGELSLDDAGSQVSCPKGGTPTATVTPPTNATLGGRPLDPNGPNELTLTTPAFGGLTVTVKATVAPRTTTSSTAAASAVDVETTVTSHSVIGLTANGVVKLASSSCEASATHDPRRPRA